MLLLSTLNIRENSKMVKDMELEHFNKKMETYMKVSMLVVRNKVKEL